MSSWTMEMIGSPSDIFGTSGFVPPAIDNAGGAGGCGPGADGCLLLDEWPDGCGTLRLNYTCGCGCDDADVLLPPNQGGGSATSPNTPRLTGGTLRLGQYRRVGVFDLFLLLDVVPVTCPP